MIKESRILLFVVVFIISSIIGGLQFSGLILGICYVINLIYSTRDSIAFREYTLAIYAINYLFSPAILYNYNDVDFLPYKMNCSVEQYFTNAISGMFALHLGIFFLKTNVFKTQFTLLKVQAFLNQKILKTWVFIGLFFSILNTYFTLPSEIAFFIVLLSGLRYVGLFGLVSLDFNKNRYIVGVVVLYEFYWALSNGFFHDLLVWIIFFGLYISFILKIGIGKKVFFTFLLIALGYLIQNSKADYRQKLWNEGGAENTVTTFTDVAKSKTSNTGEFLSEKTMLNTLVRINQGWIAASTYDNMDRHQNFAGIELLNMYTESALLPRFLAPNKLNAGDKELFNKYSGHTIRSGTSMALGVMADGYASFGFWGIPFFCFGLGVIFCFVFKIVEQWGKISPFFILMLFPILNYAVRPDCELQTTLGQLVKGTFAFWLVIRYYKNYFEIQTKALRKLKMFLENKESIDDINVKDSNKKN